MTKTPNARMGQKGYIFTISTFFLVTSILLIAMYFSSKSPMPPSAAPKLTALYDDIGGDVFGMLSVSVQTGESNNLTFVLVNDTLPDLDVPAKLAYYERYMEDSFSSKVNEHIEGRAGSLAGADVTLNFDDTWLSFEPYDYRYEYDTLSKNGLRIYPESNNTNLRGLFLNISTDKGVVQFVSNVTEGDLPVRIVIRGSNLTMDESASISRTGESYWILVSDEGFVRVTAGKVPASGRYRDSALSLDMEKAAVNVSTLAVFRKSSLTVDSGLRVWLTDLLGHRMAQTEGTIFTELIDYTRIRDTLSFPVDATNISRLPIHVEPEAAPPPVEVPVLLGYCYCAAPCYYWEEYWEGDGPCNLRQCPDYCAPSSMLTYLL